MKRDALSFLESWKKTESPKPLVLRGARQVGKSLQVFVQDKQLNLAVRFNADLPSQLETQTAIISKEPHPFTLISLPLYMAGQVKRIIENYLQQNSRGYTARSGEKI